MCGGFVAHEGLDVEIYGNLAGRVERDRDAGGHFFRMDHVALSLHTVMFTRELRGTLQCHARTSNIPSAKIRTDLMMVSLDVERVTSTCG